MNYRFLSDCVGWPRGKVDDLHAMIDDAREVTRATFIKNVGLRNCRMLEGWLGYETHPSKGMTMAGDWHVEYYRSRLCGHTVYYVRQSSIEHVFAPSDFNWSGPRDYTPPLDEHETVLDPYYID